jgi:hypothetical protein
MEKKIPIIIFFFCKCFSFVKFHYFSCNELVTIIHTSNDIFNFINFFKNLYNIMQPFLTKHMNTFKK